MLLTDTKSLFTNEPPHKELSGDVFCVHFFLIHRFVKADIISSHYFFQLIHKFRYIISIHN